jgi:hypothetical protein
MRLVNAPILAVAAAVMAFCSDAAEANSYYGQVLALQGQYGEVNSVAISGDLAVVGAPYNSASPTGDGAAAIYVRQTSSCTPPYCTWSLAQTITPSDSPGTASGAQFGLSVAISGTSIIVGAPTAASGSVDSGAVYVFTKSGSSWTQTAKLVPGDASSGEQFGWSVAATGTNILVGATSATGPNGAQGAAYLFGTGTGFPQVTKMLSPTGNAGDLLGFSVALSSDTALVGGPYTEVGGTAESGAVEVFTKCFLTCTIGTPWPHTQQLSLASPHPGEVLGWSVAIDGTNAVIGSPTQSSRGEAGAAYIFSKSAGSWSQVQRLLASDGGPDDLFGYAVGISGSLVAVSGLGDGPSGLGGAYTFVNSGGTWTSEEEFDDGATHWDLYGSGLALSGGSLVVSGPSAGPAPVGEVFFYTRFP